MCKIILTYFKFKQLKNYILNEWIKKNGPASNLWKYKKNRINNQTLRLWIHSVDYRKC